MDARWTRSDAGFSGIVRSLLLTCTSHKPWAIPFTSPHLTSPRRCHSHACLCSQAQVDDRDRRHPKHRAEAGADARHPQVRGAGAAAGGRAEEGGAYAPCAWLLRLLGTRSLYCPSSIYLHFARCPLRLAALASARHTQPAPPAYCLVAGAPCAWLERAPRKREGQGQGLMNRQRGCELH